MRKPRLVPEFSVRTKPSRAGFIPGHFSDHEVETWQVWCHDATGQKEPRRGTTSDMRAAGYVRRKR